MLYGCSHVRSVYPCSARLTIGSELGMRSTSLLVAMVTPSAPRSDPRCWPTAATAALPSIARAIGAAVGSMNAFEAASRAAMLRPVSSIDDDRRLMPCSCFGRIGLSELRACSVFSTNTQFSQDHSSKAVRGPVRMVSYGAGGREPEGSLGSRRNHP